MGEKVYGLLGRKLGHSWSAPIHAALGCADYRLIELEPEELGAFLAREDIGGLNVTIPYKRDVMAYCDVLDPMAEGLRDRRRRPEIHVGHPHGQNPLRGRTVPLAGVGPAARNRRVEIVLHRSSGLS